MTQDVLQLLERYRSEDMTQSAKLASTLHWRRLQLLLLGDILAELRKLNEAFESQRGGSTPSRS